MQEWAPGSGIYVLGAYAALQLGPGALNLAGAKTGAALVVDSVRRSDGQQPWLLKLGALQQRYLLPG